MRDIDQRAIQCDKSAFEKCLERLVVISTSERVSVPFCGMTKVFEESHNGGIVVVEQTRWRHAEKSGVRIEVCCPLSSLLVGWGVVHFSVIALAF